MVKFLYFEQIYNSYFYQGLPFGVANLLTFIVMKLSLYVKVKGKLKYYGKNKYKEQGRVCLMIKKGRAV